VCVKLNDPQAELPHVTDQSTPVFNASPVTTAVSGLAVLTCIDGGGPGLKDTLIAPVIVIAAEIDFVLSPVEVAFTVTMPPVGTAAGAVYVVAPPLGVWAGANDPQAALLQLTDQSTPASDESFATVAVIEAVRPACSDFGGAALNETEITGGGVVVELEPPPHPTRAEIEAAQMSGRRTHCLVVTCKSP
jgi:hypothetical protein